MKNNKWYSCILPLILIIGPGCHTFYKAESPGITNTEHRTFLIDSLIAGDKYFVLRSGYRAYYMKQPRFTENKSKLACVIENLPASHSLHVRVNSNKKMIYRKTDEAILKEVHIYIPPNYAITEGSYDLSADAIDKIEILEKDKVKTSSRYFLTTIAVAAGAVAIVVVMMVSAL